MRALQKRSDETLQRLEAAISPLRVDEPHRQVNKLAMNVAQMADGFGNTLARASALGRHWLTRQSPSSRAGHGGMLRCWDGSTFSNDLTGRQMQANVGPPSFTQRYPNSTTPAAGGGSRYIPGAAAGSPAAVAGLPGNAVPTAHFVSGDSNRRSCLTTRLCPRTT